MPFWELVVPTAAETSEGLTNFLWEQGALGVVEEEMPGERPRLRAFYPEVAPASRLVAAVSAYRGALAALGQEIGPGEATITPLLDEAWAQAWQAGFPPREIGRRLLVLPPWDVPPPSGHRLAVIIEPGRAFGTGHHGSTEGCLVLLEDAVGTHPPACALDIGTGSGILAVAAIRLGATSVLAIDVDPDAVAAAGKNAARNGIASAIDLRLGGLERVPADRRFPLVLANLLRESHRAFGARYEALLAPAGALVLGGMLADEDHEVEAALAGRGLALERRLVLDGWASHLWRRLPS
ncbi:MAG: 50S ribosomal protein L11 methyltransferase [Candidatus Rokubacteria bacterium]|nr:50S ribosomal protein L11 methyltransferase [Candidatus Rokubacteria bacterium]